MENVVTRENDKNAPNTPAPHAGRTFGSRIFRNRSGRVRLAIGLAAAAGVYLLCMPALEWLYGTGFSALMDRCILQRRMSCTYIVITPTKDENFLAALNRLRRYTDREPVILCGEECNA